VASPSFTPAAIRWRTCLRRSAPGRGEIFGLHVPTLIMIVVVLAGHAFLTRFVAGRAFYALGGNEEAARLSGLPVNRYKLLAYILSGFTRRSAASCSRRG